MKLPMKSLMKCLCSGFACLFLFLLAASPPVSSVSSPTPSTPAKTKPTNAAKLIDQAAAAFTAGELENAIGFYEQAKELLPDLPQIPYNQAIAHYRKGDFQRASELFNDAILLSENPELQNKARYNLGNAIYEQSRPYLTGQNAPPDPQKNAEQLEKATKGLEKALDHYKQAVNADPQDLDARHNAELSHQLLKQLRELQEQEQQQQQDSQDQQDEQDEQDQQQGQDQQQQQDQQNQDQQDQQQQSQSGEDEQQQEQQQQSEGEEEEEAPQLQPDSDEQEGDDEQQEQEEPQPQQPGAEDEETKRRPMSKEQAEGLLQSVRDKERKRRSELARREANKRSRVDKDW